MSNQQKNTGLDFNATGIDPAKAIEVLPNGWYNAEITDAEVLPCKGAGSNERVSIEYTVVDGEHKGRKIWDSINHNHSNAQTQEIGQRELSAVCHATGVLVLSAAAGGVAQFIGKMLQVKAGLAKVTKAYPDPKNEVKGRKALENAAALGGAGAAAAPPAFAQAQAPAQPAAAIPPAQPGALPPAPAAEVPVSVANPIDTALADGWLAHPQSPGFYYKGQEVLAEADLAARYPSAPAAPAAEVPGIPATPAIPAAPAQPQTPPFEQPAQPAAAPAAGGVPAAPTGAAPAWAQQ